jgi:hypothetical protein
MTGGGDRSRESRSRTPNEDGLGAFASEAQEAAATGLPNPVELDPVVAPALFAPEVVEPVREPVPLTVAASTPKQTPWQWLESPALVSVAMALAVVVYGAFMVLWWEREPPQMKPAFQSPPTASYRPVAPAPTGRAARPPAAAPSDVTPAAEPLQAKFLVPAVARAGVETARPAETAAAKPPAARPERPEPSDGASVTAAGLAPLPEVVAAPAVPLPEPEPPPVAAAAAASAIEPRAVDPVIADRAAIGDVLQSYRTSYNALDATSVSTIWQGLDTRALQRAFSTLSEQTVSFDRCDVRVTSDDRAEAVCRGLLTYVPKIGDGSPQQRRLAWTFDFRRAADRWLIAQVSAR